MKNKKLKNVNCLHLKDARVKFQVFWNSEGFSLCNHNGKEIDYVAIEGIKFCPFCAVKLK